MFQILLVDDDAYIRKALQRTLLLNNYVTFQAENGSKALNILKSNKIDLVITDILMPEMDGVELIRHMKKRNTKTLILAISGGGSSSYLPSKHLIEIAKTLGADSTLMKPFTSSELLASVEILLDRFR